MRQLRFDTQIKYVSSQEIVVEEIDGATVSYVDSSHADWRASLNEVEANSIVTAAAELNRLLESLANLVYLIQHNANHPPNIDTYCSHAERCLVQAREIVREQMIMYSPIRTALSASGTRNQDQRHSRR